MQSYLGRELDVLVKPSWREGRQAPRQTSGASKGARHMGIKRALAFVIMVSGLACAAAPAHADDKSASAEECKKAMTIIDDLIKSGCNDKALYDLRADAQEQLLKTKVSHK